MIGVESWECLPGQVPTRGGSSGQFYDIGVRYAKDPEFAAALETDRVLLDDTLQNSLGPPTGKTSGSPYLSNDATDYIHVFDFYSDRQKHFDLVELANARPPNDPHLPDAPFDWLSMGLRYQLFASSSSPSAWRLNTVGRHPTGRCLQAFSRDYPVAGLYWLYSSFRDDQSKDFCD